MMRSANIYKVARERSVDHMYLFKAMHGNEIKSPNRVGMWGLQVMI